MKKRLAGRKYTNRLAWSVWKIAQDNKKRVKSSKAKDSLVFNNDNLTFNSDNLTY